MTFKQGI